MDEDEGFTVKAANFPNALMDRDCQIRYWVTLNYYNWVMVSGPGILV
jgi:hypothetical protein